MWTEQTKQLSRSIAQKTDTAIHIAIMRHLKRPYTLDELKGRLSQTVHGSGDHQVTQFAIDGTPILLMNPPRFMTVHTDDGYKMEVTQHFEQLLPETETPAA